VRVLLVEDEPTLAAQLSATLAATGFVVEHVADGEAAYGIGLVEPFDAVVLDLGLPKLDGLTVLSRWRAEGVAVPVLILTARERWSEKLAGFNAGADDYVTKPFTPDEVAVRLRALIRRASGHASPILECGPLRLHDGSGRFTLDGAPLSLTAQEFRILEYLMHRRDRVVTRLDLVDHVYDRDGDRDSNVIDVLIARIRRKLGAPLIETLRGQGWRLATPAQEIADAPPRTSGGRGSRGDSGGGA
jgi:DNA-binding response OmpR family regulator